MKYNIITFGSATQDIFIKSKEFSPALEKNLLKNKEACFLFGSKIKVDDIFLSLGGGGTNSATTFVRQGFKTAYCGMVGEDVFGELAIKELENLKIDTSFIKKTKEKSTNISVSFNYPGKDKMAFVYRGASDLLNKKNIPFLKIKNIQWFYLAPFAGKMVDLTEDLINFAKKNKIKVALNPGYNQLSLPKTILERILKNIDVLILNREEASLLAKIHYDKEAEIFKKINEITQRIVVMTKGREGAVISDGKYLYQVPILFKRKPIDTTGAGDAFGSGFVSGLIQKNDIVFAAQLAAANSAYCVNQWGAKKGLLKKEQSWSKVKVIKIKCLEGKKCWIN